MKNITLSADERLIRSAREKARKEKTTLNSLFRKWLAQYTAPRRRLQAYEELMERLSYVRAGGKFSRDELNER
jgi:hypothetical protein